MCDNFGKSEPSSIPGVGTVKAEQFNYKAPIEELSIFLLEYLAPVTNTWSVKTLNTI